MREPEISNVTWSAKGIRVVYTGEMVVHLSAEDMYLASVQSGCGRDALPIEVQDAIDSRRSRSARKIRIVEELSG